MSAMVANPNFNYGEFATIRNQSGLNSFKISVKEFVTRTKIPFGENGNKNVFEIRYGHYY